MLVYTNTVQQLLAVLSWAGDWTKKQVKDFNVLNISGSGCSGWELREDGEDMEDKRLNQII